MAGPRKGRTRKFARRLYERRRELRWNRRFLAEQMKVSVATIGNWERGKGFPRIGSRDRLCELLGRSAKELRLPPFEDMDGD